MAKEKEANKILNNMADFINDTISLTVSLTLVWQYACKLNLLE
jgi:hypothetical protein